ncbi:MAG TPA: hypothetical protein VGM54_03280 [Chthoniobacter sp.]|jgi:outer membrane protein OmpA-like peptidoglycan-associated protein/anti-anti-sigma regulatory factor
MSIEIRSSKGAFIAAIAGILDETEGDKLVTEVTEKVPKGSKLVIDGSGLAGLDQHGVLNLMTIQRRAVSPERKRLLLAGLSPAVWQTILNNGGDVLFEAKPTLAEALQTLGVPPEAAAIPPPPPPAAPSAVATGMSAAVPERAPSQEPDPWQRREEPRPSGVSSASSSASVDNDAAWSNYRPATAVASPRSKTGGKALWLAAAGAAVILLVIGVWWMLGRRSPELTISTAEITAEAGGKEVDEVTVDVQRGTLVESSWNDLPAGLYFEAPSDEDSSSHKTYTLRGKVDEAGKGGQVQLVAENKDRGQKSNPVTFTVKVTEKPLSWQLTTLQSLHLTAGQAISGQAKFLAGTTKTPTATGLPPGVTVEKAPGTSGDWRLGGTPASAGKFDVQFVVAGEPRQEKSCTVEVAPAVETPAVNPPASADATSPAPSPVAPPATGATASTGQPQAGIDDGMRSFLLERIEHLPSRYTDTDRENLRMVVNGLKAARLIQRIEFEREGQREVSASEIAKLKAALQAPENAALLKTPDCQIVVVGYASKSGSLASNVRLSKERALTVDTFLRQELGRNADLCGDYGPTDIMSHGGDDGGPTNRVVEIYAGIIDVPPYLRPKAESFKEDFNRRHGAH